MAKNSLTDKEAFSSRFEKLLETLGVTAYQLAKHLNTNEAKISNIKNGKSLPGTEFFSQLLNYNKAININWLLTGYGEIIFQDGWVNEVHEIGGENHILKYRQVQPMAESPPGYKDEELEKDLAALMKQIENIRNKILQKHNSKK